MINYGLLNMDKIFEYFVATDQVDEALGFEKSYKCPKCGDKLVNIIYGKITDKTIEEAKKQKYFLGGCLITDHDPKYYCYGCGSKFYEDGEEAR